jgi:hypothetical protein
MRHLPRCLVVVPVLVLLRSAALARPAGAAPEGTITWGLMHVPIYELAFLWGVGPRVEEACVDHIKGFSYSAPYEDLKLKAR